jgi:hypothetical protein
VTQSAPPSGTPEYAEYLRSINVNRRQGQTERAVQFRDDMGSREDPVIAGVQTTHWDGRQDALVTPRVVNVPTTVESPGG